ERPDREDHQHLELEVVRGQPTPLDVRRREQRIHGTHQMNFWNLRSLVSGPRTLTSPRQEVPSSLRTTVALSATTPSALKSPSTVLTLLTTRTPAGTLIRTSPRTAVTRIVVSGLTKVASTRSMRASPRMEVTSE